MTTAEIRMSHAPLTARLSTYARLPERVPFWAVQLTGRIAVAHVFWNSAQTKLASWEVTRQLFAYEYALPLIDPDIAAVLGTAAELAGSVMLALGLFARFGALMLIGVVATIQLFVFPENWGDHLLWFALLALILVRGAGAVSIDAIAARVLSRR
ncbi:DoxX family protein [Aquibium sp. LZ166]|uniref:DoxX family protein n=1 Tax=Aquibium pacificus TaxID=3153579 RepID=A0ABV3SP70_9HYPH